MAECQEVPDRTLLHLITREEEGALEALYARYSTSVFSLAMFMLKQKALAEEATQGISLNIWLKASSYEADRGEPKAWTMNVAHYKIVGLILSRRETLAVTDQGTYETLEQLPSPKISTEGDVERRLDRERIMDALGSRPLPQRQVIFLA